MGREGAFDKASVKKAGGGFGASTSMRFDAPRTQANPAPGSYSLERHAIQHEAKLQQKTGGFGKSKASRFEDEKTTHASSSSPSSTNASVKSKRTGSDYYKVLAAVEASVNNPPPTELGTAPADAAWLAQNASADGVIVLPCGLQYKELARGRSGKSPKRLTPCECHFQGFHVDGTEFDSSYAYGRTFDFVPGRMIQGWTVAMQLMGEGDSWEICVPPHMAYGDSGRSSEQRGQYIHPGAVLVYILTIVKVKGPSKAKPTRPPPSTSPHAEEGHYESPSQGVASGVAAAGLCGNAVATMPDSGRGALTESPVAASAHEPEQSASAGWFGGLSLW